MKVLVLGGTAWLGHVIARSALAADHDVTCVARGSAIPDGAALVRADRDEASALDAVKNIEWDAVIDVARQPGHVRRAVRDLEPVAARYVFVSTANVYASQEAVGADEDIQRLAPLAADTMSGPDDYGPAKVAGEDAIVSTFGVTRCVIARAGLIGGPGDPTGRTTYWPWRFARPSDSAGRVLVPDVSDLPTGVIDVRDLAQWLVRCAEGATSGVFNAMGPPVMFPEHLAVAQSISGDSSEVVLAPEPWLIEQGVNEWSGPRSLPLWLIDRSWYGMNARSNARARAAGLVLRPLEHTLADGLAWRLARSAPGGELAGLSNGEERQLLRRLLRG